MEIRKIHSESTWELRHKVMWPERPLGYVQLPNDDQGLHYGLFVENRLVSVVSAFITNQKAQFRKFATLNEEQGKGYGSQLLNHLFDELTKMEITKVWCNARSDKAGYYERFGLVKTKNKFDKGGISYVIMEKTS